MRKTIFYSFMVLVLLFGCEYEPTRQEKTMLDTFLRMENQVNELQASLETESQSVIEIQKLKNDIKDSRIGEHTAQYFNNECSADRMIIARGSEKLKSTLQSDPRLNSAQISSQFKLNEADYGWERQFEALSSIEALILLSELQLEIIRIIKSEVH